MHVPAFRANGEYVLVQFTDTHLGRRDEADERTLAAMDRIVEIERPDLVVLSGDIIHAHHSCTDDAPGEWRRLVPKLDAYGMPWMFVFGNHDAEEAAYADIDAAVRESAHSLYERGPSALHGWGNYSVPVLRSGGRTVGAVILALDSGRDGDGDLTGWGYVHEDQVQWMRGEAGRVLSDRSVTGILFTHNPLPQHETVWRTQPCIGSCHEDICFQGRDTGLFDALRDTGISVCSVGHDHVNDFSGDLDGVALAFGRATGYSAYGRDGFERGARVFTLTEGKRGYRTHIRLADGTIAEQPEHSPEPPDRGPE